MTASFQRIPLGILKTELKSQNQMEIMSGERYKSSNETD